VLPLHLQQHIEAVELAALQPDIEDDERRPPQLDGGERLVAVLGEPCAVALVLEDA
jgi:hypothetical protein